jgi:hypothetical protein
MFVVRLKLPDREPDYKAFTHREAAQSRFEAGRFRVTDGDLEEAAIFEVAAGNARTAIDAVIAGKAGKASLVDIYPQSMTREQAEKFLADLGL